MNKYKNFILDFGGVLYKIKESNTVNAFKELSGIPENEFFNTLSSPDFKKILDRYEIGKIKTKKFKNIMIKKLLLNSDDEKLKEAWNTTLISLYDDALENVKILKEYGKIVLLSNTNETHYEKFEPKCRELFSLFDECFFSFKIGMRKPDIEIYDYVVNKMNFDVNETVFVDDSETNLKSAKEFGLSVFQVKKDGLSEFIEII